MREQLFKGKLDLPSYQNFVDALGPHYTDLADKFLQAIWHQYLQNKGPISLPYWADRFDNLQVFNLILFSLSDAGWIESHSIPARNWAEVYLCESKLLEYVSPTELAQIRANFKFTKYISRAETSTKTSATRLNGKTRNTGLIREGFMKAGNTQYQLDTDYITNYYHIIKTNTIKGMDRVRDIINNSGGNFVSDQATYDTISVDVLNYHIYNPTERYSRGDNYNDSRGRAISSGLSKVFNPISNKDARSLLVIPE